MTLEEFFILSGDKDGFTTPTRVDELFTLMQKEIDDKVKSFDEAATRQHTAIARSIIETKNIHCLDHFVKLGGLSYINWWLNDALKSATDTSCDFIEESITSQCRALEKLGLSSELLISSGILDTVKKLCDYNNTTIKVKARELLDNWKDVNLSLDPKDVEKVDTVGDNVEDKSILKIDKQCPLFNMINVGPEQTETSKNAAKGRKEEEPDFKGINCLEFVEYAHIKAESTCSQMAAPFSLGQINLDGGAISVVSKTMPAAVSHSEVTPMEGILNIEFSNSLDVKDNVGDGQTGGNVNTNNGKVTEMIDSASADLQIVKFTFPLNPHESEGCSSVAAEQTIPEHDTQINIGGKEDLIPMKDEFVDDAKVVPSDNSSEMGNVGNQRSLVDENPERTSPALDEVPEKAAPDIVVGLNSRTDEDYTKVSAIQNLARVTKSSVLADTKSDIGIDYGLMDALEVARQVAKAVEMNIVHDGSYDNNSEGSRLPGSPDSASEIESQSKNQSEESSSKLDSSPQLSTERKIESGSSDKTSCEPEECLLGIDQPESLAQEDKVNSYKNTCEFDLNQEVTCENEGFSVNLDHNMGEENRVLKVQNSLCMPVPVASGSTSCIDAAQLGGSQGWRGSVGNSGKQKQGSFCIDLNLDKEVDDGNMTVTFTKSKKLDFDLNMMSDVDDTPPSISWSIDKQNFSHLDRHPRSSLTPPPLFPIPPINNNIYEVPAMQSVPFRPHPFLVGTSFSQNVDVHPFSGMSSPLNASVQKDTNPSISIMGARVEVNRNSYSHGAPSSSNGNSENHLVEANMGPGENYISVGSNGSYGHPAPFAYSNTSSGPTTSFMSPMFRPGNTMTYMVDPRVGPLPHMVNSSSVAPHMYAQSPFFMSMAGPPHSLNGGFPSRPNIDLNLGFMNDGGNRQDMASRMIFNNNQGRFVGEQLSSPNSQPSSSLGKRKESETGWVPYTYNAKHHYPPGNL